MEEVVGSIPTRSTKLPNNLDRANRVAEGGQTFFAATTAFGVNDAGTVSGSYADASSNEHGFLYSGGIFNRVDVAGAKGTQLTHIPNKGAFAGYFTDQLSEFHGVTGH